MYRFKFSAGAVAVIVDGPVYSLKDYFLFRKEVLHNRIYRRQSFKSSGYWYLNGTILDVNKAVAKKELASIGILLP